MAERGESESEPRVCAMLANPVPAAAAPFVTPAAAASIEYDHTATKTQQ